MAKNPTFHSRTEQIKIKHHFIRELIADGEVALVFVGTSEQKADILTKYLTTAKHEFFKEGMGVHNLNQWGVLTTDSK